MLVGVLDGEGGMRMGQALIALRVPLEVVNAAVGGGAVGDTGLRCAVLTAKGRSLRRRAWRELVYHALQV
jgi:hypothetical protein